MWRRNHTTSPAAFGWPTLTPPAPPQPRPAWDDTRRHAANWLMGVAGLAGMAVVAIWWLFYRLGWADARALTTLLPLAPATAVAVASYKLIRYTRDYRRWLYEQELPEAEDSPDMPATGDGAPAGTLLMGPDGAMHRVEVALTPEEITTVKRLLLTDGVFNVRALSPALGERASTLRQELYRLGILEQPRERVATKLTPAGKKAVMRWR